MASEGDRLRQQSAQAESLASEIQRIVAQVEELGSVFTRVRSSINDAIGGSATGTDRRISDAIAHAESQSRTAAVAGTSASRAATALARDFEAKAREAERREEELRRTTERTKT